MFDREVNVWSVATQGYEIEAHRRSGRFTIMAITMHAAERLAARS